MGVGGAFLASISSRVGVGGAFLANHAVLYVSILQ